MNKDFPLISIIAVNYNCKPWVLETLNSIAAQTYQNVELIIVDDFSTDESPLLIEHWLKDYQKTFYFIQNEKNLGVCASANIAIKKARGEYISFISTDDVMLPEKTELQVDLFMKCNKETGMIYSDAYLIDENSEPIYGWFIQRYRQDFIWPPSGNLFNDLMKSNFIPAMSVMIKKEVFEKIGYFDESLTYEDYDMWLRISDNYHILFHDYPSVKYRIRKGSLVSTIINRNPSLILILLKYQERVDVQRRLMRHTIGAYLNKDYAQLDILIKAKHKIPKLKNILRVYQWKLPHILGSIIVKILYRIYKL